MFTAHQAQLRALKSALRQECHEALRASTEDNPRITKPAAQLQTFQNNLAACTQQHKLSFQALAHQGATLSDLVVACLIFLSRNGEPKPVDPR